MKRIVTADEMRAFEQARFADGRADSLDWMERAGDGVSETLCKRFPGERALVVCGGGNNGGDGFVLLRLLLQSGAQADGVLLADPEKLKGDAKTNYLRALECGAAFLTELSEESISRCGVVVDALFGTGLSRTIAGKYREAVERINQSGKAVVAVDMPSGVDASTGEILGAAVRADVTVTFQFYKRGQFLFPGRTLCGEVVLWPLSNEQTEEGDVFLLERQGASGLLPPRERESHKGKNGRALLCVGSMRYTGAALMCAGAALRAGVGLLTAAVPGALKQAFSLLPEASAVPVCDGGEWNDAACRRAAELIAGGNAVCIGCGVGEGNILPLIARALETRQPLVLDADALNQISQGGRELLELLHPKVVLTPHPAEMARLTGLSVQQVLRDPIGTARRYAGQWGCVVLFKGATSCVSNGKQTRLNISGNPGLAKGGSGDVLSGIITALLAQGLDAFDAASAGAYLLGVSADTALELLGTRFLLARDVVDAVRQTIERLS
jgi:NAD(P)H-hydrate epimerase